MSLYATAKAAKEAEVRELKERISKMLEESQEARFTIRQLQLAKEIS